MLAKLTKYFQLQTFVDSPTCKRLKWTKTFGMNLPRISATNCNLAIGGHWVKPLHYQLGN
jgi:hypothetical protein